MIEDIIGYLGGFFIMISFIPQVIRSYKTKSVEDLSVWMIIATLIGTIFWIAYGFLINGMPVIVMNSIFGVIVLFQLYLKIKHDKKSSNK
ncbi:PQ-loop repeat-containing protein [Candidatus Micrarchaeota archaeon]|nr:PQ-loop repeat-containing protein [Candidatus Micrarchaeota archaeon]